MSEPSESSRAPVKHADTPATGSDSDQSMEDVQSPSPTNTVFSNSAVGSEAGQARPGTSSGPGRKRKVPDSCDGAKPGCQRCVNRNVFDTCLYELHAKTAKEQMVREIQRLQRRNEDLEEEKDTLGEKNSWIEQIMSSLKDNGLGKAIINRLKRGESHQSIAEWLGRPLVGSGDAQELSPTTERSVSQAIEQYYQRLVDNRDPRYWTNVTQDTQLIEHLMTLYFTWIHPVHMLFDERRFMASLRHCSEEHCSSALVSVICAVSCHLLHNIDNDDDQMNAAVDSLRNQFMEATRNMMKDADDGRMTTIQTHAVMYLAEFGTGHGLIAASHLRLAVETLIEKQNSEQAEESERVAVWGILSLHTAWSGFIYQKPLAPISIHAHPCPGLIPIHGDDIWCPYKQPGDADTSKEPSFSVMTAAEHAKLFRIVHESISVYCGRRGRVTAHHLLDLYESYLMWRDDLPPEIRDIDHQPLPHVIFLHVQYRTALIQLLQPMLHLGHMTRDSYAQLQSLVLQHATAGLELLIHYRNMYSNSHISPLQLLCLVQLCDAIVRYDKNRENTSQTMRFCLASLEDAKVGYPVAAPLQKMFRNSLAEYSLRVPDDLEELISQSMNLDQEALLDACTRTTYRQPLAQLLHNVHANTAQEFITRWQHLFARGGLPEERIRAGSVTSGNERRFDIGSLLNP